MIPSRIKLAIEKSSVIQSIINHNGAVADWKCFTRTTFDRIARRINQEVTRKVLKKPYLVSDFLLFGEHEFENVLFRYKLNGMDDLVQFLGEMNYQKPYGWISGKTLQAYWDGKSAKDKKLNILLTFLDIDLQEWDDWKNTKHGNSISVNRKPTSLEVIKQHFSGYYYRYYQKTDHSPVLIKAPFLIREDHDNIVVVETKTMGHHYKSSHMIIRNSVLYLECENLHWDEKENFIFNIGFETDPEVVSGVSSTLNRKGQAIALKNILVKQKASYDYPNTIAKEIPFTFPLVSGSEEARMVEFFKNGNNAIVTPYLSTLEELSALSTNQKVLEK